MRERGASAKVLRHARVQRDAWRRTQAASVFTAATFAAADAAISAEAVILGATLVFLSQLRVIGIEHLIEDPPRLDFTEPTTSKPPIDFEDAFGQQPLERVAVEVMRAGLQSVAVVEALVTAHEREQGAEIAGAPVSAYSRRIEVARFVRELHVAEGVFADIAEEAAAAIWSASKEYSDEPPRWIRSDDYVMAKSLLPHLYHSKHKPLDSTKRAGIPEEALDVPMNRAEMSALLGVAAIGAHDPLALLARQMENLAIYAERFRVSLTEDEALWIEERAG
jgi:hypothetical protein